ncbi:GTP-binding protein Rit2, partial [Carlito syrichta]|uniref:GTP-binding protein Rit2 n=1 Tax=Carlito syrichta TaxID=1868482 RepID=A0A1U7SVF1_CARSF
DAYKTQVRIDNEPAYLDILDTAGQAEFTAMREQYMRGGEGFIICYSVTDRQSFQEAAKFKELIFQVRHTYEIPLVLVGNKIDLEQFRQRLNVNAIVLSGNSICFDVHDADMLSIHKTLFHMLKKENQWARIKKKKGKDMKIIVIF